MVSFGDTTYGLESGKGLYYFVPGSAGVSEQATVTVDVSIMPNPSTGNITIIANGAEKLTAKIYDVLGNLVAVANGSSGSAVWNGESNDGMRVSTGAYVIRITGIDSCGNEFVATKEAIIE